MSAITRQQLCADLSISESTLYRLEQRGLPYTPVGIRGKRYDPDEVRRWLRQNPPCQSGQTSKAPSTSALWSAGREFTDASRKVQLRVLPSS